MDFITKGRHRCRSVFQVATETTTPGRVDTDTGRGPGPARPERGRIHKSADQGVHQVGVLLTYPDCSQSEIHFTVQLEGAPNLPETEAEAISWKKVHLTMDQWKKIQEELGLEKSVKSANVSLDNLVTGKRRSKPVTPVKSLTKKRVKKGGEHVETSAQSESDLNGQIENTSDEEINNQTTPKRTRLPRKPILKNLVFLLTQGKPKHTGILTLFLPDLVT